MMVMKKIISLISAVLFVVMLGSCDTPEEVEDKPNIEDIINDKKVITRGGTTEEKEEEPKEEVLLEVSEEDADFVIEANGVKYNMVKCESNKIFNEEYLPTSKTFDENDLVHLYCNDVSNWIPYKEVDLEESYTLNTFCLKNYKYYGIYKVVKTTDSKYEIYTLYREFNWHFELERNNTLTYVIDTDEVKEIVITLDKLPTELKVVINAINS